MLEAHDHEAALHDPALSHTHEAHEDPEKGHLREAHVHDYARPDASPG